MNKNKNLAYLFISKENKKFIFCFVYVPCTCHELILKNFKSNAVAFKADFIQSFY